MRIIIAAVVASWIIVSACGPTRYVEPLEKNQLAAHGHFGGPIFTNLGYPMPIPLTSVGVGYGLSEKITLFSDLQLTEVAFGVMHLNIGGTYYFSDSDKWLPGLSSSIVFNNAINTWDGRAKLWPQLDLTASWSYGKKGNLWYTGLNNFFELSAERAHEQEQPRQWVPAIFAGHTFTGKKWNINLEGKYIAPFAANNDVVVDYIGAGTSGTFGIYLGIAKKF